MEDKSLSLEEMAIQFFASVKTQITHNNIDVGTFTAELPIQATKGDDLSYFLFKIVMIKKDGEIIEATFTSPEISEDEFLDQFMDIKNSKETPMYVSFEDFDKIIKDDEL